jgi:EpsI family protein
MEKKSFVVILLIFVFTFVACTVIRYYRAPVGRKVMIEQLPLTKGAWIGQAVHVTPEVMEMLSPDQLFSASYVGPSGNQVQLFIDYFSPENTTGAIHSPRNCLPGAGWIIVGSEPRIIEAAGRRIPAIRMYLALGQSRQVMDFWYITRFGETANDYRLKFNTMISSLTLRPTDKAFVRFLSTQDPQSVTALEDFERLFIDDIYAHLPF